MPIHTSGAVKPTPNKVNTSASANSAMPVNATRQACNRIRPAVPTRHGRRVRAALAAGCAPLRPCLSGRTFIDALEYLLDFPPVALRHSLPPRPRLRL